MRELGLEMEVEEGLAPPHAPWSLVVPGGSSLGVAEYWAETGTSPRPLSFSRRNSPLTLELRAPEVGPVLDFAQPVFLQVRLSNHGDQPLGLPLHILDPKAGMLRVDITRRNGKEFEEGSTFRFRPLVSRTIESTIQRQILGAGQVVSDNLNLHFGADGFPFAEPGEYSVVASLSLPGLEGSILFRSALLRLRVGWPHSRQEEQDAYELFEPEIGVYIALGGSDALSDARERLQKVAKRRKGNKKICNDPLITVAARCAGVDLARRYTRWQGANFTKRKPDYIAAVRQLEQVTARGLRAFDVDTSNSTWKLLSDLRTNVADLDG